MSAVTHCKRLNCASSLTATQDPRMSKMFCAKGLAGSSSDAPWRLATAGRGTPMAHSAAGATSSCRRPKLTVAMRESTCWPCRKVSELRTSSACFGSTAMIIHSAASTTSWLLLATRTESGNLAANAADFAVPRGDRMNFGNGKGPSREHSPRTIADAIVPTPTTPMFEGSAATRAESPAIPSEAAEARTTGRLPEVRLLLVVCPPTHLHPAQPALHAVESKAANRRPVPCRVEAPGLI
mmetsp:Transcript_73317/g.237114  ORF Transcript_73317/g.237114 Transcript_73317/m.237114 type:complete len:239 (-) Transcript_73317:311-1027(-)